MTRCISVILGFNVASLPDANDYTQTTDIKIFNNEVIYRLIDDFRKYETEQRALAEKKKFARDRPPRQSTLYA